MSSATTALSRIDRFAELMANGATPKEAGISLGLTVGQTARTWQNIKRDLGSQAR